MNYDHLATRDCVQQLRDDIYTSHKRRLRMLLVGAAVVYAVIIGCGVYVFLELQKIIDKFGVTP